MRVLVACLFSTMLIAACRGDSRVSEPEASPGEASTPTDLETTTRSEALEGLPVSTPDAPSADVGIAASEVDGEVDQETPADDTPSAGAASDPRLEAPEVRDLAAELTAALGTPSDCTADFTRATPTTIRVSLTALVRATGAVTQASANGTGLTPLARQCIARRTESIVLRPLEGGSSQRVSTVIEIDYVPPSSTVTGVQAGAPDPRLRNTREPLPPRPEVAPSGRPIQEPTSRPIQEPTSRPVQEPGSRRVRGPQPRPIDGWDVDESAKDWR